MQQPARSWASFVTPARWATLCLSLALSLSGCKPPASTKKPEAPSREAAAEEASLRVQRNLQNALDALQPDKLGIASGPEQAIAVLNEWAKGAKREAESRGEPWEVQRPHPLLKSLPNAWLEQVSLSQFIERDASFLRDCVWASKATRFAAGNAEKDLDVVVNLFEYVVRNLELMPPNRRKVPLGPFDVMVMGRGTARDRAWVFAELLRQRNVDAVLLSPRRSEKESADDAHFLVGVLFEKDVLLFDPTLGVPVPFDVTEPKSPLPRRPASLRQAQRHPEVLAAIARDSGGAFTWTTEDLLNPQVELISYTELLSARMLHLQRELTGDQSLLVSDPLEDVQDQPGLWSRVTQHPSAAWSPEDVAIWSYPEHTREAAAHLSDEQQKELARIASSMAAPQRIKEIVGDPAQGQLELEFTKPERALLRLRMQHVMGQWPEAVQGYLGVQLYDVNPPTTKVVVLVTADGKERQEIGVGTAVEMQNLRLVLMQPKYASIRQMHLQAGDDACFWQALCQFEQGRLPAVVNQCVRYADQHSSGRWIAANQRLWAETLARQNRLKEAIRTLKEIEPDHPEAGGHQLLRARWQRLLQAAE